MTIQLKRNDTKDTISYTMTYADGTPVNLTGATVRFFMGNGKSLISDSAAVVKSANVGQVEYTLTDADTLIAGTFKAEFQVTFSDGKVKTFPTNGYIMVNIQPNMDVNQSTYIEDQIANRVSDLQVWKGEIQSQLDQFAKGDSAPEVAQARVEKDGTTNTTLKARLDKKEAEFSSGIQNVSAQLAQNVKKINDIAINIKNHGAVGGEDSTIAIRDAISECYNLGGGDIIIPPSDNGLPYLFTQITIKENVRLLGVGGKLKFMDNICVDANTTYYLIHNFDGLGGTFNNTKIVDLDVDGNGVNNTLYKVADTITLGGENSHIINCKLYDAPDSAIMFAGVKNGLCTFNRIDKVRDVGIYVNDGTGGENLKESIISNNRITNCPAGISLKRVSQRVIVSENTITDGINGITLEHASTDSDFSKNISIINNKIRNVSGYGINLRASIYSIVVGNRLEDFGVAGIFIEGDTKFSVITANIMSTSIVGSGISKAGIRIASRLNIYPSFNTIQGNTINIEVDVSENFAGIWLAKLESKTSGGDFNIIGGNIVKSNYIALRVEDVYANNTLSENTLDGTTNDLYFASGVSNYLINNVLKNNSIGGSAISSLRISPQLLLGTMNVYSSTSIPTSGTYKANDYVVNLSRTIKGTSGSQYIVRGWSRLTTGSSHVLNTDWIEDRGLTGT